jgi:hypothetical protein
MTNFFWFLDPKIVTKSAIRCILEWNLLNKTQGLTLLSRNLYRRYPKDVKFQNSVYLFWFLDPKIVPKNFNTFVLRLNFLNKTFISPFWVGIYMGGTLRTQNFEIRSVPLLNTKLLNKSAIRSVLRWNMLNKNQ